MISLAITFGAGFVTILGHYSKELALLIASTYNQCAWFPLEKLQADGVHQIFEAHEDAAEKLILNLFASLGLAILTPLMPLVVAPVAAFLHAVAIFQLGIILHSVRLLLLQEILSFYEGLLPNTGDMPRPQPEQAHGSERVNKRRYHTMIFMEVLAEAGPSTILTIINYFRMRQGYMVQRLSWTAFLSLIVSCYLLFQKGYKYFWWLVWKWKSFDDIPLPYSESVELKRHSYTVMKVTPNDVMAAGGAMAGVGSAATATALLFAESQ